MSQLLELLSPLETKRRLNLFYEIYKVDTNNTRKTLIETSVPPVREDKDPKFINEFKNLLTNLRCLRKRRGYLYYFDKGRKKEFYIVIVTNYRLTMLNVN